MNITSLLAQDQTPSSFSLLPSDQSKWLLIVGTVLVVSILLFLLTRAPSNMRRPVVVSITFIAGFLYFLEWVLPKYRITEEGQEVVRQWFFGLSYDYSETVPILSRLSQLLTGILLALGVFSIFRLHVRRLLKRDPNWFFSLVLLSSLIAMAYIGFSKFGMERSVEYRLMTEEQLKATNMYAAYDLLFDKGLQTLDAAMFSLIAFFILSAAYRAFRIRSIEATIMMAAALLVLLSFVPLGIALTSWINPDSVAGNLRIESVGQWILLKLNTPALRAIDLGLGLGVFAMGIRIMLGLERGVSVD
ncbi:MAG: hypothetical protein HND42_02790 [Armatimonadetes bacterium]|nr:hypothetical protein [Armatimonadota bacterium]NOG92154.1 hypothetical protein [Armatimonadota bacterium]